MKPLLPPVLRILGFLVFLVIIIGLLFFWISTAKKDAAILVEHSWDRLKLAEDKMTIGEMDNAQSLLMQVELDLPKLLGHVFFFEIYEEANHIKLTQQEIAALLSFARSLEARLDGIKVSLEDADEVSQWFEGPRAIARLRQFVMADWPNPSGQQDGFDVDPEVQNTLEIRRDALEEDLRLAFLGQLDEVARLADNSGTLFLASVDKGDYEGAKALLGQSGNSPEAAVLEQYCEKMIGGAYLEAALLFESKGSKSVDGDSTGEIPFVTKLMENALRVRESKLQRVAKHLADARFTDAFADASDDPDMKTFIEKFQAQNFKEASALLEKMNRTSDVAIRREFESILDVEQQNNKDFQHQLGRQLRRKIRMSGQANPSEKWKPQLLGRAMVWDYTKSQVDPTYELLADDLRGSSRDGQLTMFCIVERTNIEVGRYSISGQPAYQEKLSIGVVYWPNEIFAGRVTVYGGRPPSTRTVRYVPEYGSAVKVAEWISGLKRTSDETIAMNHLRELTGKAVGVNQNAKKVMKRLERKEESKEKKLPSFPTPVRSWTDLSGRKVEASVAAYNIESNTVTMVLGNGSEVEFSVAKLSAADQAFLNGTLVSSSDPIFPTPFREWTDVQGRVIKARITSYDETKETVTLELPDGTTFPDHPVSKLSQVDREFIESLLVPQIVESKGLKEGELPKSKMEFEDWLIDTKWDVWLSINGRQIPKPVYTFNFEDKDTFKRVSLGRLVESTVKYEVLSRNSLIVYVPIKQTLTLKAGYDGFTGKSDDGTRSFIGKLRSGSE